MAAVPADKREWLRKSNLRGTLDVDGSITSPVPSTEETALDLAVTLHDGKLQLPGAKLPLDGVSAKGRMTADGMTLTAFAGKFEKADLSGTATVRWTKQSPSATAAVRVTGLAIDDALLSSLPDDTRRQVASLRAQGTLDADLDYASADKLDYRLALRPHDVEMTPGFFPVTFKQVRGEVIVQPGSVRFVDMSAANGKAMTTVNGNIDRATSVARLSLGGRDWTIDDETSRALPSGLRQFVDSLRLRGGLAFDCPSLKIGLAADEPKTGPTENARERP